MIAALAIVKVGEAFETLQAELPEEMQQISDFFKTLSFCWLAPEPWVESAFIFDSNLECAQPNRAKYSKD